MGQFTWIACDDNRKISCGLHDKSYVLIPMEFGGGHYIEKNYAGFGEFAGYNIFKLVADWNKDYISVDNITVPVNNAYKPIYRYEREVRIYKFKCRRLLDFISGKSDEYMCNKYGIDWKIEIGQDISFTDDRNSVLRYPIKIAHKSNSIYERYLYSALIDFSVEWKNTCRLGD